MGSQRGFLQLLAWACLASSLPAGAEYDGRSHVLIAPQDPVVEIGSTFSATCVLFNTTEATADDLYWVSDETTVPKEQYTQINQSAVNVTITITSDTPDWLFCKCKKDASPYVMMHAGQFLHGIKFTKGYPPEKPENLSCVALQDGSDISPLISCEWQPGTRGNAKYTLHGEMLGETRTDNNTQSNNGVIIWDVFPNHMRLDMWVEAENKHGRVESEHLREEAEWFVKTNPPTDVKVIPEKDFPTSLLMKWTRPIAKAYIYKLMYQIRFSSDASPTWTDVPAADIGTEIESFRLQFLQPDSVCVTQVRCKHYRDGYGYWSDWSANATARTPEDVPKSKPDVWRVLDDSRRRVTLICKDPVVSNGKIRSYDIRVRGTEWESIPVNSSDSDDKSSPRKITVLREIHLSHREMAYIEVTAKNSVGKSPKAVLVIGSKERPPVEGLKWGTHGGQLWLEWLPPHLPSGGDSRCNVSEYIVEWSSLSAGGDVDIIDWQREHGNTTRTIIRGSLKKFTRYSISVYPLYCGWTGKQVTQEAFLEQGVPLEGPSVGLKGKPGSSEAELVWKQIPHNKQHGFITNYTIFYSTGTEEHAIAVSADTYSYLLKPLSSDTKYMVWIGATTIQGSVNGTEHSFSTLKYAPGEIEGIVGGVCFGFLFLILLIALLCIYKKESIKKNFWPQIPNPGNSSIGTWSPDFPSKTHTPKEKALSDVSVVEVDMFDGKSVFEEDKTSLSLKKDKYLSEEHSSGIGGSSCMSSPRQSVSDSDEGGDSSETTASTVQYSSVVASNGYKGQTPCASLPHPQPPTFSRSESTQPLLDSEENSDTLGQEGSRQSKPCFRRSPGNQDSANSDHLDQLEMEDQEGAASLRFCPLEEGSQQASPSEEGQSSDWQQAAPVSNYMPQLGGYRQQ